jgi:hypothetical protein
MPKAARLIAGGRQARCASKNAGQLTASAGMAARLVVVVSVE